jgi:hypothetical protein
MRAGGGSPPSDPAQDVTRSDILVPEQLRPVARLTDHPHARTLEQAGQTLAKQDVVIGQDDPQPAVAHRGHDPTARQPTLGCVVMRRISGGHHGRDTATSTYCNGERGASGAGMAAGW